MKKRPNPNKPTAYTFVLWGANFDEIAAVIFTARLRQVGLPVQVVGLVGPQAAGLHGLTLHPDLTLSEALPFADHATCVVLPCSTALMLRIENDPRVATFLQAAATNNALFVVGDPHTVELTNLCQFTTPSSQIVSYMPQDNLFKLARSIALTVKHRTRSL